VAVGAKVAAVAMLFVIFRTIEGRRLTLPAV
jgi:hypothetical protein